MGNRFSKFARFFRILGIMVAVMIIGATLANIPDYITNWKINKLRVQANAEMAKKIEEAKKETSNPCSRAFMKLIEPPEHSTVKRTLVVVGREIEPGSSDIYSVIPGFNDSIIFIGLGDSPGGDVLGTKKTFTKQCGGSSSR